jgi:hypothetical protein
VGIVEGAQGRAVEAPLLAPKLVKFEVGHKSSRQLSAISYQLSAIGVRTARLTLASLKAES